jgi:hypothetical protein
MLIFKKSITFVKNFQDEKETEEEYIKHFKDNYLDDNYLPIC